MLFIGSGVAATCQNEVGQSPPTWAALLTTLCQLVRENDAKETGLRLIANQELLAAADHVRFVLSRESDLGTYFQTIRRAVDGPTNDPYRPSQLYTDLLALEPKVVFTTNYDKLFESAFRIGYSVHPFDSPGLSHDLRQGEPVLVKLHGSTDAMQRIVLTRTDYARVRREGRPVYEVLEALSLTSTILFVGYSMDDPDIQLVLQAVGAPGLSPEAHFMLGPEPASPARAPVFKESFGVSLLPYPQGEHAKVGEAIVELGNLVLATRAGAVPPVA